MSDHEFVKTIWKYYKAHGRHNLPWRLPEANGSFDPYKILISEIMLQQTQVSRVVPKYQSFLQVFPTIEQLATANLGDVLRVWNGLGYNRRAKFLWQTAQLLTKEHGGVLPADSKKLITLPGIGVNTAGAILTYAFNQRTPFIETNIRAAYIHYFFTNKQGVADHELRPLIEQTWDKAKPREFGWALMDYGSHLKATVGNVSAQSKHHTKQSRFEGSVRQIRGHILKILLERSHTPAELNDLITDQRLEKVLQTLTSEGLIQHHSGIYSLT